MERVCSPGSFCQWRNFDAYHNSAAFFKDTSDVVHLKGLVAIDGCDANSGWCIGSNTFAPTEIFVLPTGYRPAKREVQVTISENKLGRATITPDGRVIPEVGSTSFFSLDGITFRAGN